MVLARVPCEVKELLLLQFLLRCGLVSHSPTLQLESELTHMSSATVFDLSWHSGLSFRLRLAEIERGEMRGIYPVLQ